MELSREEQAMINGELGEPRRWAIGAAHYHRGNKKPDLKSRVKVVRTEPRGYYSVRVTNHSQNCGEIVHRKKRNNFTK